jgi:hypothetical protein
MILAVLAGSPMTPRTRVPPAATQMVTVLPEGTLAAAGGAWRVTVPAAAVEVLSARTRECRPAWARLARAVPASSPVTSGTGT